MSLWKYVNKKPNETHYKNPSHAYPNSAKRLSTEFMAPTAIHTAQPNQRMFECFFLSVLKANFQRNFYDCQMASLSLLPQTTS